MDPSLDTNLGYQNPYSHAVATVSTMGRMGGGQSLQEHCRTVPNTAVERNEAHWTCMAHDWSTAAVTGLGCSVGGPCVGSVRAAEACSDRGQWFLQFSVETRAEAGGGRMLEM